MKDVAKARHIREDGLPYIHNSGLWVGVLRATAVLAESYKLVHISVARPLGEVSNSSVVTSHFVVILVARVVSINELRD